MFSNSHLYPSIFRVFCRTNEREKEIINSLHLEIDWILWKVNVDKKPDRGIVDDKRRSDLTVD